jgi:spermidine synthase
MYKYNGLLVHQSQDEQGILEIIEEKGVRSLHFGSSPKQSSMLLDEPNRLHSPYARAMMAWLLFRDNPEKLLMIGLGGGILAKYYLYHFPECYIKAVECRKTVVKIARSHFGLPLDPRLKVLIDDGGQYIRKKSRQQTDVHDLLIIDAFDQEGLAEPVKQQAFFDDCKNLLSEDGILIVNLWSTDKSLFEEIAWYLGRSFNWRVLFLPVRKRGNIIGFAFSEKMPQITLKQLKTRAVQLESQYQIEFPKFIRDFKKHNREIFNQAIR